MRDGYSVYRSANVDTADQGKLILIAYDVAIKNCRMAIDKFGKVNLIEERTKHLLKVQDAISELMGSLKMEAGEIANNLYRLYDYMLRRLIQANAHQEKSFVEEILKYLEALRAAWNDAIQSLKPGTNLQANETPSQGIAITG